MFSDCGAIYEDSKQIIFIETFTMFVIKSQNISSPSEFSVNFGTN